MDFWFHAKTFYDFLIYCADYGDLGRLERSKLVNHPAALTR
jgi:hypothetical protein